MADDQELAAALRRCNETCIDPPFYSSAYLEARRAYHLLLVQRGLMTQASADNDYRQMQLHARYYRAPYALTDKWIGDG